jgi:hypothetical protein
MGILDVSFESKDICGLFVRSGLVGYTGWSGGVDLMQMQLRARRISRRLTNRR